MNKLTYNCRSHTAQGRASNVAGSAVNSGDSTTDNILNRGGNRTSNLVNGAGSSANDTANSANSTANKVPLGNGTGGTASEAGQLSLETVQLWWRARSV